MITEDYVSFETAKLLKEKGFDYTTETGYNKDGHTIERAFNIGERSICGDAYNWNKEEIYYSRPTLWETMRWLRKVHNIAIETEWEHMWYAYIKPMTSKPSEEDYYQCESSKYEEACEAAVRYILENLI